MPALTLQVTDVSAVLVTLAVNCWEPPDETTALAGATVGMETLEFAALLACDPGAKEHPAVDSVRMRRQIQAYVLDNLNPFGTRNTRGQLGGARGVGIYPPIKSRLRDQNVFRTCA